MALSPTTPNPSSSSSSQPQPLPPATQQLHTRLQPQQNLHNSANKASSSSPFTPQRNVPFFISGDASTTPHQDTTSHGRRIAGLDLNCPPSDMDFGGWSHIPQRIRLTKLKRLARANKKVELDNPDQKKKRKNDLKHSQAGSEENRDDFSQRQLDAPLPTLCGKRNRCLRRNSISDSGYGRTCHQCHQKTTDFVASCKSGTEEKPCGKAFCFKCLWNRYGEKAEEENQTNDWRCPCCRKICNCSRCMRERGFQPAGIRGRAGRKAGFRCVMEKLASNGTININKAVNCKKASATEERFPNSDGRTDVGTSNSKDVHLSSEVNPRVGVDEEKSERAGGGGKKIPNVIKTVSSRNDVLSVLLSPSRGDYMSLLQPSDSV